MNLKDLILAKCNLQNKEMHEYVSHRTQDKHRAHHAKLVISQGQDKNKHYQN